MKRTIGAFGLLLPVIIALAIVASGVTTADAALWGMKHVSGVVVAVDEQAKTLTVAHTGLRKTTDYTFTVAPGAADALGRTKPGERVKVGYVREHGELTARAITPLAHQAQP